MSGSVMQTSLTNPLISVVIPVYNASDYLLSSIQSILNQSYNNLEILIADDASTDESWTKIQSLKDDRLKVFRNSINKGYLETCNFLFEQCSGDLITFQDADDISDLQRIEIQVNEFIRNQKLGICGTSIYRIDTEGRIIYEEKKTEKDNEIKARIGQSPQFCGATIMITKLVLKEVGGYRTYFNRIGSEDYDWSYRIVENNYSHNINQPLYYYRQHSGALSKEIDVRKMISAKMVQYFGRQRSEFGMDDLDNGAFEMIKQKESELTASYIADRSLIYVEYASWFMYNRMYRSAIDAAIKAVRSNIFSFRNIRTLAYCLRITLLNYVRTGRKDRI